METTAADCATPSEGGAASQDAWTGAEVLGERFQPLYVAVYGCLLHRLFDAELAEELTAETFYRAARAVRRFQGTVGQLRLWLLRTATNLANSHYRRKRLWQLVFRRLQRSRPLMDSGEQSLDDSGVLKLQQVRVALKGLAPRHQSVIALRYFMDMPFEQIGAVLGCRQDAVRVRLSRALKALRRQLGLENKNA